MVEWKDGTGSPEFSHPGVVLESAERPKVEAVSSGGGVPPHRCTAGTCATTLFRDLSGLVESIATKVQLSWRRPEREAAMRRIKEQDDVFQDKVIMPVALRREGPRGRPGFPVPRRW
jgi:hypothetical protein